MTRLDSAAARLRESLVRLSDPAAAQLRYLTDLGVAPLVDELALEFDDAVQLLPDLVAAGRVTEPQAQRVRQIDRLLERMSKTSEVWTTDALSHPSWIDVRRLAASIAPELVQVA